MGTFVYLHVPKTGGTSVGAALSHIFPDGTIHRSPLTKVTTLDGYSLVTSHGTFQQLDELPGEKHFITSIRQPVNRLISLYRFSRSFVLSERANLEGEGDDVVHGMSFDEFIGDRLDNEITRQFCGSEHELTEDDFETAMANVERCHAIFRTENLDQDLGHFFYQLGCANRFRAHSLNVTDKNWESNKVLFKEVAPFDLGELSDDGRKLLREKTAFDRRLYAAAAKIAERKRGAPLALALDQLPIERLAISHGESIVPSTDPAFAALLDRGWAPVGETLWAVEPEAVVRFRVNGGTTRPTIATVVFNACMVSRRAYTVVKISVNDGPVKTVLFLQQDTMIRADFLKSEVIDVICTLPRPATLSFDLDPHDERFVHTVRMHMASSASPSLLGHNDDRRPLGLTMHSLSIA